MKKLAICLAAAATAISLAPAASAQVSACNATNAYNVGVIGGGNMSNGNVFTINSSGAMTLCYGFQLTQAMTLSSAGFTVAPGSPYTFNTTGTSLGLYSSANALSGYTAYTPITSTVSSTYDSFGPMALASNYYVITVAGTSTASLTNTADVSSSFRFSPSAVPEPAAWALMILGFGVVGYALRRRPSVGFAQA